MDTKRTGLVLLGLALCAATVQSAADPFNCETPNQLPSSVCFLTSCAEKIQEHIKWELDAAFSYLYLASYFDSTPVGRPGLAKFLYGAASEEREHAIMFLDYLNKRGILNEVTGYTFTNRVDEDFKANPSYKKALELAINLEILVTKRITNIIKTCEEDFHAADFLTEPVMAEQHESIRKLQGTLKELINMGGSPFHEYLLDRKILEHGL